MTSERICPECKKPVYISRESFACTGKDYFHFDCYFPKEIDGLSIDERLYGSIKDKEACG